MYSWVMWLLAVFTGCIYCLISGLGDVSAELQKPSSLSLIAVHGAIAMRGEWCSLPVADTADSSLSDVVLRTADGQAPLSCSCGCVLLYA